MLELAFDAGRARTGDALVGATGDCLQAVAEDLIAAITFHDLRQISLNCVDSTAENREALVVIHDQGVVATHVLVEVALCQKSDLLLACGVFERQLVATFAAW